MSITHHEVEVTPVPLPVSGPLTDTELRANPVPVSGTVNVGNFPATQNVNVTGTVETEIKNDSGNPLPISGSVSVSNFPGAETIQATVTNTSVGTSAVTILAANATRRGIIITNESGTLFVKFGSGASSTSYTYRLVANTTVDLDTRYPGVISAVKVSGTTPVLSTELFV